MKKIDLGPAGLNVAHNVRRFRGNTGYAELSRQLAELGRPIPPLGLRQIEAGNRRVDVDDLAMLAVALDVLPVELMGGGDTRKSLIFLVFGTKSLRQALAGEASADGR